MLSLYLNTNKMLVQASDIDKQMVYFDSGSFCCCCVSNIRASLLLLSQIQNQTKTPSDLLKVAES